MSDRSRMVPGASPNVSLSQNTNGLVTYDPKKHILNIYLLNINISVSSLFLSVIPRSLLREFAAAVSLC